jgi:hypothetical protein
MLAALTGPDFLEPEGDLHWLAKGSQSFATPGRWGISTNYTNGWWLEGGYLVLPNIIPALGYYQLGQVVNAETYANIFLDKWVHYGPHEAVMEYNGQMPGRFAESSLFIEMASATTWLLQQSLGIEVNGTQVNVIPQLSGQFVVRNVQVTSQGLSVVFDYARDAQGKEWINITRNDGLNVYAPGAGQSATATPTSTCTPTLITAATETPTPIRTNTAIPNTHTPTRTNTAAPSTNTPTPTPAAVLYIPLLQRVPLCLTGE